MTYCFDLSKSELLNALLDKREFQIKNTPFTVKCKMNRQFIYLYVEMFGTIVSRVEFLPEHHTLEQILELYMPRLLNEACEAFNAMPDRIAFSCLLP